jgi:organic radical activating enzyme
MMTLAISQIFGPTIQGEGTAAGRHCLFVRLFNCNLECKWCDTAYTWAVTDNKAAHTLSGHKYDKTDPKLGLKTMCPDDIIEELLKLWPIDKRPTIIVISGGEPMMQQANLAELVEQLDLWGNDIHVETAGTISPYSGLDMYVTQYNVSPKLAHSGNLIGKRYQPAVLRRLNDTGRAQFKFVVTENWRADLAEIDHIVKEIEIPYDHVMVMPEGTTPEATIATGRLVVDATLERGYGLTFRSHVLLWGDDPGR